jgi:hypothetical protein
LARSRSTAKVLVLRMSARCWEAEKKLDPEPGLHVSTLTA